MEVRRRNLHSLLHFLETPFGELLVYFAMNIEQEMHYEGGRVDQTLNKH